eukprot:scaffold42575_cov31-Tisochrysis_lutea.AAC.1
MNDSVCCSPPLLTLYVCALYVGVSVEPGALQGLTSVRKAIAQTLPPPLIAKHTRALTLVWAQRARGTGEGEAEGRRGWGPRSRSVEYGKDSS